MSQAIQIELERVTCCACGLVFGIEATHRENLINTGATFYCPSGHPLTYGEDRVKELETKNQELRSSLWDLKRKAKVRCPHCREYFRDLDRHIRRRHKEQLKAK